MSLVALSELLGAPVRGATGAVLGRVREIAIAPQDHPTRIAYLIVRTADGERVLPSAVLKSCGSTVRTADDGSAWEKYSASDGVLLLKRDLLDQQIIDVHGRKVVRVNDVELDSTPVNSHVVLSVVAVDVGARGAIRRLTKGIVPSFTLRTLLARIPPRVIPWAYVDLLETDPARRVKLKIVYEGLSKLHPADIANIVEDLPHAEREAVFETLDEEVDVLPGDHPGRDPLEERPQGEGGHQPFRQAADRAAGAHVHGDDAEHDVAVDRRGVELDVVDANDLPSVDVDDLLIEQVALEQQHAVGWRVFLPVRGLGVGANGDAGVLQRFDR